MPLVVPVLRLAYVFINVFETFKTLRLPPPSARNNGQPSARAMSQRKRAMKGCMTVWLVWVCFALYERWAEAFVWLFVPFYSEIKALFILFFIITRAKGAEPIYLHVLRPVIKPYAAPLDALFDGLISFADLLLLIGSIPINYVRGFYRRWTSAWDPPQAEPETWHRDAPSASDRPATHRAYVSESDGQSRPAVARDISTRSVPQTHSTIVGYDASTPTPSNKIWHPPASAYTDEIATNPLSGLPTPPIERQQRLQEGAPPSDSDDWRQYPAFPSAYPPTPLPVPPRMPSVGPSIVAPRPVRAGKAAQFSGIEEEDNEEDQPPETRQGFRRSLLLPREPRNPGSDGDLSDENQMNGVQQTQTHNQHIHTSHTRGISPSTSNGNEIGSETEMSVDDGSRAQSEDGSEYTSDMDEDDGFNTTLRTPFSRRQYRDPDTDEDEYLDDLMLTPPPMKTTFSMDSVATRSTALSTTDNGSSLRTRTHSLASTDLSSVPEAPSLAGRKRRHPPRYAEDDVKFSVDVPASKVAATGKSAPSRASSRTRSGTIGRGRGKALQEVADELAEDDDALSDDSSSKRQRVPGGRIPRPKPARGDSQGTIRAPSVRSKSSSTTRPTISRPPSVRVTAARKERAAMPVKKPSTSTLGVPPQRKVAAGAAANGVKTRSK